MCFFSLKTCPIFNLPYVLMCRLGSKADLLVGQSLYYNTSYTSSGATHYYQSRTWISEGYATIGYYCSFD